MIVGGLLAHHADHSMVHGQTVAFERNQSCQA